MRHQLSRRDVIVTAFVAMAMWQLATLAGRPAPSVMATTCEGDTISEETASEAAEREAELMGFSVSSQASIDLMTFDEVRSTYGEQFRDIYKTETTCAWVAVFGGSHARYVNANRMRVFLDAVGGLTLHTTVWTVSDPTATPTTGPTPTSGPSPTPTGTPTPFPSPTP
jgi:hypothetical protein